MPSFVLDPGTGSTAYRANIGPYSVGTAIGHNLTTPTIPTGQRGQDGTYNKMLVVSMSLDVAGWDTTSDLRARIWSSSGTNIATSNVKTIAANTAVDLPSQEFTFSSNILLDGATSYRFGVHAVGGDTIAFQKRVNASYTIYADREIGSTSSWSTGNTDAHSTSSGQALIGDVVYYLCPSVPRNFQGAPTLGSESTSIDIGWTAPAEDGGVAIDGYYIEYKRSVDSTWTLWDSLRSGLFDTITGLSPGTTYNIRIAAKNAASAAMVTTSPFLTGTVTTDTVVIPPDPEETTTTVPNVVGQTENNAQILLSNNTLYSSTTYTSVGATASNDGKVKSQDPAAGTTVNTYTTVIIYVYSYTEPEPEPEPTIKVSAYNGSSWATATPWVWNGSSWVTPSVIKVWNGSSWVDPS